MTPAEVWLVINAGLPERRFGHMTGRDFDNLAKRRAELEAQGVSVL